MSRARVRIELKHQGPYSSRDEKDSAFKRMFTTFKKVCTDNAILHTYKQHEAFESKSRKLRRKRREAEIARLKAKLKENFTKGPSYE